MSNHFEIERNKAMKESFFQSDEKEAEILLKAGTARKHSMLPKGNSAKTSKITYFRICINTKNCVCFRV